MTNEANKADQVNEANEANAAELNARGFQRAFDQRLEQFFAEQAAGFDVPPAELYRLEGYIQAGLELGVLEAAALRRALETLAERYGGEELLARYRADTRLILHQHMAPAPVYPSTRDD